jgi:hypothetical protein
MRFLLALILTLASVVLSADAQTKRRPGRAPARKVTVKQEAPPPAKTPDLSSGTTVEKYISNYELNADGTGRETREIQQRCSSESCLAQLATFKMVFNGDLQKAKALDAYIIGTDGVQRKIPATAISDRMTDQAEAAPSFSSLRELEVKFDDLKIDEAVFLKFEIVTTRATFEGKYDSLEIFPLVYDWKSIEINISSPANYPLFIDAVGLDGGKLADANGRSQWQYRRQNVIRIPFEPLMHDIVGISPRLAMTAFPSANDLGSAFWTNVKKKAVVTPEVQALADQITKDLTTPSQQASAIYDWVNKNIRYLSIVLDRGGWIPHSSAEILKNGYGDCKDYTTIIHALLKAKAIESVPVLIRSDFGNWFPSVATADYFNHVILYIPSLNVFADATTPNTRLGLVPQTLVGKSAVLAGEKTGIIQIPKDNPADNQILSEMNLEFSPNGDVKARTRNTFVGRTEIVFRPMFGDSMLKRYSDTFVKFILAYYGVDGDGNIISVGNPFNVGEPFTVEMEARVGNFTTFVPKGKLALPNGMNMVNMAGMEQFISTETRNTSIIVGASRISEDITITLPPAVKAVAAPAGVSFSNAVGTFKIVPELKNGVVHFTREMTIKRDVIEPKDYPIFKELVKKLLESHEVEIEYTADPSLLRAKSKELRAAPAARSGARSGSDYLLESLTAGLPKELNAQDVRRLEKKLAADQSDIAARLDLIRYYSLLSTKKAAATETTHVNHRIWLVNNRPDIDDEKVYGFFDPEFSQTARERIKTAWLAQIDAQRTSSNVRLNAIAFLKTHFPDLAEKLAQEGAKLDPDNYKFPLVLTDLAAKGAESSKVAEQKTAATRTLLENGVRALALIKRERSPERDSDRNKLLARLCKAAVEAGDLDAASSFAQELILDFGQSSSDHAYDQATHVGNITLGMVELKKNNVEKAKEFLMIAIRAPLRQDYNSLSKIDTTLAKELYKKGEKSIVVEYLKLGLELGNLKTYPESYADEIYAMKLWIEQISKGVEPNFDFDAPESRVPLPKGVVKLKGNIVTHE